MSLFDNILKKINPEPVNGDSVEVSMFSMIPMTLWLEKIPGKGEDSAPLVKQYPDGSGVVMVFDGLGGSGSTKYNWEEEQFTGAWFGSRVARALFASFLPWAKRQLHFSFPEAAQEYGKALTPLLQHALKHLDKNPSKLRSSMIRPLPSTISGIYFEKDAGGFQCWSLNAGDSRSYVLNTQRGLQQVTQDDIALPADALGTLISSTKIDNCLAADGKFSLHTLAFHTTEPAVFIAASDGCFDYVPFPAHFEFLLLDHLQASANPGEWAIRLSSAFRAIAGDDVSLAVAACGWQDFEALKKAFHERYTYIRHTFAEPVEKMEEKIRNHPEEEATLVAERDALRQHLWSAYRIDYETILQELKKV